MNTLSVRRWKAFYAYKPGFVALCFFAVVFGLSLFAELLANDRPLFVHYKGEWRLPLITLYTERDFGAELEIAADYHDSAIQKHIAENGWALWPPIRFAYNTISNRGDGVFPAPPGNGHLIGTDDQGRDIAARILYGFRISALFGLCLALTSSMVGIAAGAVQGYFGGATDLWMQRFMELWGGIPVLYLLIIASSLVVMNFWLLLGIMLLFSWMRLVGVVRAETLRARNLEYVLAARALGLGEWRIMLHHVLPNTLVAVFSRLPFVVNASIITLTSLDFLGFGLPPDYPSLGELISQGKNNLHAPWIGFTVFLTMASMLASLVLVGEGLRDAFDPQVFMHHGNKEAKQP